jgi:signal transduction histidine kinase/ActR/RegA family two-component response regulator
MRLQWGSDDPQALAFPREASPAVDRGVAANPPRLLGRAALGAGLLLPASPGIARAADVAIAEAGRPAVLAVVASSLFAASLFAVAAALLYRLRGLRARRVPVVGIATFALLLIVCGGTQLLELAFIDLAHAAPAIAIGKLCATAVAAFVGGWVVWKGHRLADLVHADQLADERAFLLARESKLRSDAEALARDLERQVELTTAAAEVVRRVQSITEAALQDLPPQELMLHLLERLRGFLGGDTAVILLLDPETNTLRVRAAIGLEEEVKHQVRVPVGVGFAGTISARGEPLVLDEVDPTKLVSDYLREKQVRSLIGVPLMNEGRLAGVLHVGSCVPRHFTPDDVRLLQLAGQQVGSAIERASALEMERRANARMEEASQAKDAFLATLSHELRTPLNAIVGWADLLAAGDVSPAERTEAYETILRAAHAQAHLVNDILDVSRLFEGRLHLDVARCEPSAIVRRALDTVMRAARAKGLTIHVSADPIPPIVADPVRLQQVIWNLLSNAVKFTPNRGAIRIELRDLGSHVVFSVHDTGKGIRPGFLPHLFERFTQEDPSSTRSHGGLGLGLAIARHIVELHGGAIQAKSEGEGHGSTFIVTIPRGRLDTRASGARSDAGFRATDMPASLAMALDAVRILVVDDEAETRNILSRSLTLLGAEVVVAGSADEAQALLERSSFDLMVSDIAMPERDGYELMRTLRRREAGSGGRLPAIALTAYASKDDRRRALEAGFDAHLAKPVRPREIARQIAELLAAEDAQHAP